MSHVPASSAVINFLLKRIPAVLDHYGSSLPLRCELEGLILVYYSMYWKSFPSLATLPMDISMDFPIDIGLGYKLDSNQAVKQFISLAEEMFQVFRKKI